MFFIMNPFWFLASGTLYLKIVIQGKPPSTDEPYVIWVDVFANIFTLLYGVSHWIYAISYLQLAYKLKNQEQLNCLFKLNVVFLALNISIPIVGACVIRYFIVNSAIFLFYWSLQIFTVCVLMFALRMIQKQVDELGSKTLNLFALRLHQIAYFLFAIAAVIALTF